MDNKRVLLVEDCEMIIEMANDAVDYSNGKVKLFVAKTLKEVHDILGAVDKIDMVLLDGYIKNGETTETLPLILKEVRDHCMFVVSTSTCEVMNKSHYENGADAVIDKGDLYGFLLEYKEKVGDDDSIPTHLLKYMRF